MGKTKDLFKKNRDIKGTFNAKMGTIIDRNIMDLKEEEEVARLCRRIIKKKKKNKKQKTNLLHPDNHSGVITHLEPDILECKIRWTLRSIIMNKASGVDGIPVELFQILKDDAVKVLHSIHQQIWKAQQWP